jgi:hypothetical protein
MSGSTPNSMSGMMQNQIGAQVADNQVGEQ